MRYGAVGINDWFLLPANGYSSVNPIRYSLAVLGIKCLLWLYLSLMFVHYALHWIAFNLSVERWTILTLISNECGSVIDFNSLLPVGPSIMLLPIWRVNLYSCHLWRTHLMYVVIVYHNDDARWMMLDWWMMLAFSSFGRGWFFSSSYTICRSINIVRERSHQIV